MDVGSVGLTSPGHLQVQLAGTSLQAAAQSLNVQVSWGMGLQSHFPTFSHIFLIFRNEHAVIL